MASNSDCVVSKLKSPTKFMVASSEVCWPGWVSMASTGVDTVTCPDCDGELCVIASSRIPWPSGRSDRFRGAAASTNVHSRPCRTQSRQGGVKSIRQAVFRERQKSQGRWRLLMYRRGWLDMMPDATRYGTRRDSEFNAKRCQWQAIRELIGCREDKCVFPPSYSTKPGVTSMPPAVICIPARLEMKVKDGGFG